MIVLGLDPGSRRTGWGVVDVQGHQLSLVGMGVLRTSQKDPLERRLASLQAGLRGVLQRFEPALVGIESVFHGVNVKSLVTLGQARGALMAELGVLGIPLVELSPAEVKKAVTGRGGATKEQVEHMVGAILGPAVMAAATEAGGAATGPRRSQLDATDALAVAVAAHHRSRSPGAGRPGG